MSARIAHPRGRVSLLRALLVAAACLLPSLSVPLRAAEPIQSQAMRSYEQECSSCHVAYPAGMLPAASWGRLLGNLEHHFGVDASLDPQVRQDINAWLQAHSGSHSGAQAAPPQDRITQSRWFLRQHDEVSASTFRRKSVGSASNCAACHPRAERGKFSEHEVRIPK